MMPYSLWLSTLRCLKSSKVMPVDFDWVEVDGWEGLVSMPLTGDGNVGECLSLYVLNDSVVLTFISLACAVRLWFVLKVQI